jgi:serine/threonine protein kinase
MYAELVQSQKRNELIFSALADVLPGTVLDEKYRLENKIGAGGFGAVYRATHLGLNREVAVKVFRPLAANATPEALARFQLEGISSCRINHPNAVAVLDSGITAGGIAYLVMELLKGQTLTAELRNKGVLSPARCVQIVLPICDVLAKAHASGIIHRDIKPDNIFLHQEEDREMIKVVDFGIAKLLGSHGASEDYASLTATGGFLGTPAYMSPERFENRPYDGRADVYSVGIMLYRMLCGRLPFQTEDTNIVPLVMMHVTEPPRPLRELRADIPPALEEVVLQALRKKPAERPDAKALAKELAEAIGTQYNPHTSGSFRLTVEDFFVPADEAATITGRSRSTMPATQRTAEQGWEKTANIAEEATLLKNPTEN